MEVDYEVDARGKKFGKKNVIMLAILILVEAVMYYIKVPSINIHNQEFWIWIIVSLVAFSVCLIDFRPKSLSDAKNKKVTEIKFEKVNLKALPFPVKFCVIGVAVILAVFIIGNITSAKLFNASRYAGLIDIQKGDFVTDIPESENIEDIALMDTNSARIIGERAIGSLSDVVSQYEVSKSYSTIDLAGKPMKVASLEYAGLIKYFNNRKTGIPGYVLVDPVKNEAKYVKLEKGIKYTASGYFNENIYRHVQMSYPTKLFEGVFLELDNENNPYYICPTLKANAGLFGAMDVNGVVICDPTTGECNYYTLDQVPTWVDRVYDGNLACRKYDWYGLLSGGYWNSQFGNKGCKVTTDDYGYKVMEGDVWVYTGVTSVNGDESNIGFVMINLRTGESKYYDIAGAEEYSAMSSAQGQVQHLGYVASFPSLINIKNVPTYIMVLKDNAGLVKQYALVNVEKYNIVATGATQKEALKEYKKLLASNGISVQGASDEADTSEYQKIYVDDIKFINIDTETYVYITDKKGIVYKQMFKENELYVYVKAGDFIMIKANDADADTGIIEITDMKLEKK